MYSQDLLQRLRIGRSRRGEGIRDVGPLSGVGVEIRCLSITKGINTKRATTTCLCNLHPQPHFRCGRRFRPRPPATPSTQRVGPNTGCARMSVTGGSCSTAETRRPRPGKYMRRPIENQRGGATPTHMAKPWSEAMAKLADQPNTVCKISGIVAHATPNWTTDQLAPIVNHCLDRFGPDRIMFGSDWPVCLLGARFDQWVKALKEITSNRSAENQRKLFHDNALQFYQLT